MQGGILGRVIVLATTGYGTRAPDDLGIVAGDNRAYAGQARGFGNIDAPNPGMGMGTTQHLPIEHARQLDIAAIFGLASDAFDGIDSGGGPANCVERLQA